MKELEEKIMFLQNQFNDSINLNNEQQNKLKELETSLQNQINEHLQNQIKYLKELEEQVSQLQDKLTIKEKEIEIEQNPPFEGQIVANV